MSSTTKPKSGGKKLLILIVVLALAAAGGSLAYAYSFKQKEAAAAPPPRVTSYYALAPTFVVNLADEDTPRYLSVEVQLLTRDEPTLAAVTTHAPAIRNRLLMLFSQQTSDGLRQRSAKESLQQKALLETKAVLKAEKAPANIDNVLFTSLVSQ